VERAIARARWGAAAIIFFLGPSFPNLSTTAVYVLGVYLSAYNIATLRASGRARSLREHDRIAKFAFAGDVTTLSVAMFLFSSDLLWTTYVAGTLIITAASFRFGTRGTIAATAILSVAYLLVAGYRLAAFGFELSPQRAAFSISIYVLTAFLVDRILADVRHLRVEREDLIRRLERRVAEDEALATATRIVASVPSSRDVVTSILRASREAVRFDRATVFVADEERNEYRIVHRLRSDDDRAPPARRIPFGQGLVAAGIAADRVLLVRDALDDARYGPRDRDEIHRSIITVPLKVRGRPVAVLSLSRALPDPFGPDDLRVSETVGSLIAQVMENERLFAEASEAEALRALDRLKDEFLAAVSHELRTPLTVISGALELLDHASADLTPRSQRLIDQARRNVQRLQHDVEDLLDLAQLQEAKIELSREFVSPEALLAEVASAHEVIATQRSQRLVVDCDRGIPPALVDRRRMQQVLGNLVANAVRYSPEGGSIRLCAERAMGELRFSVLDEGPGIPEADRERVFDKFYRLAGNRETASGTGLGLAIAKTLVELHGGRLWVEPRPDAQGSAFVVAVPLEAVPAAAEVIS
jgi:K+-sensing histidine kinase KdpD